MEDLIKQALSEAIRQVPGLVVLAVVVWMFSRIIFRFIKHVEDRGHVFENLHREHMEERENGRTVMTKFTDAINSLTLAVEKFKSHK